MPKFEIGYEQVHRIIYKSLKCKARLIFWRVVAVVPDWHNMNEAQSLNLGIKGEAFSTGSVIYSCLCRM